MSVLALVLLFALIAVFEVPRLVRERMGRELAAFAGLLAVGMVLSFAAVLRVELPNPARLLDVVFRPMTQAVRGFLK